MKIIKNLAAIIIGLTILAPSSIVRVYVLESDLDNSLMKTTTLLLVIGSTIVAAYSMVRFVRWFESKLK